MTERKELAAAVRRARATMQAASLDGSRDLAARKFYAAVEDLRDYDNRKRKLARQQAKAWYLFFSKPKESRDGGSWT